MDDNFDDFFDSPRENRKEKNSWKSSHTSEQEYTASDDLRCDKDFPKDVGKPPTHPNSRPVSAASKRTLSEQTSPAGSERTDDSVEQGSRRVIEAKIPCNVVEQDNEDGSYSDDSFIEEDDGPSIEERSSRRSPRTKDSGQRFKSKETSVSGYDTGRFLPESNAQDMSGSYSDDTTDSDGGSEVTNVSPLNTPHHSNIQTSSRSATMGRNISESSNGEPVRLLHGDRDSLDLDVLLQTVLHMEKQGRPQSRREQTHLTMTSRSTRHNYSFTNERVEAIDKENRRLMTSIMRHANATKKAKAKVNRPKLSTSGAGTKRLSSAAVNRAKEQQKIEAENLVNVFFCVKS